MAKFGPASAFILVGGKDLSPDSFTLTESEEQTVEQSNSLGDSMEEFLPVGLAVNKLAADGGFYDDRAVGILAALQGTGGTSQLVCYGMKGRLAGAEGVMLNGAFAAKWNRIAERAGITKANAEYTVSGQRLVGLILHGLASETTDPGDTEGADSQDNGVLTSNGATADLHVPELTLGGFTSVTVKVRHSTDDITYADLMTFTTVTVGGFSERQTSAGTVNRHLAMNWDFVGAGSGQSVTPFVVIRRNP